MDRKTMRAVGEALDTAIAAVAENRLERLSSNLSDQQVAIEVHRSLDALGKLQQGIMPRYNDWDSIFYCLWHQPGHVNLAYTLARKIPADRNPLLTGEGSLRVIDFGCGALATQFGLALAAADTLAEHSKSPQITVELIDPSESMKSMGWAIWSAFLNETQRYPVLSALRRVSDEMRFDDGEIGTQSLVWLAALHVAYRENASEVERALANVVERERPEVVLVTTHERSADYAFSAEPYGYSDQSDVFFGTVFELEGAFQATTEFRSRLYDEKIGSKPDLLPANADRFVRNYLKRHPTEWTTPSFETADFLYIRERDPNGT